MAEPAASFKVECTADVRVVSTMRRLTTELCRHYLGDAAVASRVGVATHELFENAVKYTGDGNAGLEVSLTPNEDAYFVDVRTTNRASDENIVRVERLVDLLGREHLRRSYASMLDAAIAEPQRFGLGLPRVIAEAEMKLRCVTSDDDVEVGATLDTALEATRDPATRPGQPR